MGLIHRRLDAHAHDIEVVLPVLQRLEEHFRESEDTDPEDGSIVNVAPMLHRVVELFRESEDYDPEESSILNPQEPSELLRSLMLAGLLLVGSLRSRTELPSLRDLNIWRASARDMVRMLRSTDPAWMTAYTADLPRKDQRLLRSM